MTEAEVYKALGDPIRLEIVKRLSSAKPCTVGEICKGLGVSRQGARKQLQILVNANIVSLTSTGRVTNVALEISTLKKAKAFILQIEKDWDGRLFALKNFVEG